jgi:hypothetical protein
MHLRLEMHQQKLDAVLCKSFNAGCFELLL